MNANSRVKLFACVRVSAECSVLGVMWICWLVACVRVFTFPRLASTTVCMTGALSALSAVTASSLQVSLSQSNCRN